MKMFFYHNKSLTSIILISIMTTLIGCAADKAVLPTLDGKPRIKINKSQAATKEITALIHSKTTTQTDKETSDDRSADR